MDEKYIEDLWTWTTSVDSTFENRYTKESWKEKIGTNSEYQDAFYKWIVSQDESFKERRPFNDWVNLVKKKEDFVSADGTLVGSDSAYGGTIQDYVESEEFKQLEQQQQAQKKPEDPNIADIQPGDITEAEGYGGTIQDFAESEEIQQMPTYEEQGQDLSQGVMAQATPQQEVSPERIEKDLWIREQTEKARIKEAEDLEQKTQAELEQLHENEIFQQDLEEIDADFFKNYETSKDAIEDLDARYGKYGITFNATPGRVGGIVARTKDGKKSTIIAKQNIVKKDDHNKLKQFIYENALMPEETEVKDEDYITKAFNVKKSRTKGIHNEDGSVSTVLMASADNMAFPTIFPKDPNNQTSNPQDWFIFDVMKDRKQMDKAIQMAKERGELYEFDTDEEANEFAEGGWKDVSITDLEGDAFFKERGLDYMAAIKADRRYYEIKDELNFIERELGLNRLAEWNTSKRKWEGTYRPSEEVIKNNPHIYLPDGSIRSDISEKIAALEAEEESLKPIVKNDQIKTALQDYNVYLQKRHEKEAQAAATINKKAKEEIEGAFDYINGMLTSYGVDKPINEMSQKEINNLVKQKPDFLKHLEYFDNIVDPASRDMKIAADTYYIANTYLNDKTRRHIVADFEENFAAVMTQWNEGYARGNAVSIINAIAAGVENIDELTAQELSEYLSKIGKTQGRAFTEFMHGRTWKDSLQSWLNDPLEITASLVANSFAQLLPIGWDIITTPKLAAPIVAAGAAGSFFTPVGTGVGVMSSLQGATAFGLEYGNSILEAARNSPKNYQIENPNDMLRALQDPEVWKEGSDIGIKRGLAIGAVETLTAGLAGKFFMAAKTASRAKKVGKFAVGSLVYDPLSEGLGEATAQVVSGQGLDWFEVALESLGGIGSNISTAGVGIAMNSMKNTNIATAYDLTKRDFVAKSRSSFSEISNWAGRMQRLGQIDESVAGAIQENLKLRDRAKELLGLSKKEKNEEVVSRVMDLLKAQETLSVSDNAKSMYKTQLASIKTELEKIGETGKLAPEEMTTDIDNIKDESGEIVSMQTEAQSYKINGKRYTKAKFKQKLDKMSDAKKKNATFEIKNDEEFKAEIDQQFGVLPTQEGSVDIAPSLELDDTPIVEEFYENEESIPTEIKEAKSTKKTPQEDGRIKVEYNEDEVFIEAPAVTKTFDSKEAIPQEVMEVVGEENVVEKDGKFTVTYKEVDALEALLGRKKKKEAPVQEEVAEEFENIADDDTRTFSVESIDEIPEQYRDRAEQASRKEVKTRKTFFGIPIGKETTTVTENFTYTLTGKEIKEQQAAQKEKIALEEKSKKKDPRFRLKKGKGRIAEDKKLAADVKKKQKEMSKAEKDFMVPRGKPVREDANPLAESRSTTKFTEEDAKALGFDSVADMTKKIEDFEGMPMGVVMSDHLAAGTHKDSTGKPMEIGGGILFNTLGAIKNRLLAWAGVNKEGANLQYQEAKMIYKANKALFDRLWSEGKLPYGHIPFAVAKMGETAMNSNEAVFRWLSPRMKELEKKYKNKAKSSFNIFLDNIKSLEGLSPEKRKKLEEDKKKLEDDPSNDSLREKIEKAEEKQSKQVLLDFVKKNKITTMSQLLDAIVADSKKRAKNPNDADLTLPVRAFAFDRIFSVSKAKDIKNVTPSKDWIKELLADSKNKKEENQVFIANSEIGVYNQITEPSMLEGRQGDIVAVVGIKVLDKDGKEAGGVAQTDHNNYGFGPEGKLIAFLSNPMHGTDVFAEWEVKSARVFKQDKAGKVPSKTSLMTQIGGAFFIDKAFRGMKVSTQKRKVVDLLVAKMRHAFPSVGITSTKAEFDAIMERDDVRTRVKDGMVVYGVTLDGNIYLNPEAIDIATPIHEYGHIWIDYLRYQALESPKGKAAKLLQKGFELAKSDKKYKEYLKKYGDAELAAEELLVELMATRGETIVNQSLKSKFKEWFNAFFKYIKQNFKTSKDISSRKIKDLTIEEFANIGLADLFGGTLLDGKFDPSNLDKEIQGSLKARFSIKEADGTKQTMDEIITMGRQNAFPDERIKEYLKAKGFKTRAINKAMSMQFSTLFLFSNKNTNLPDAFLNVSKGAKEGLQLFNEVKKSLDNWLVSRWGKGKSFIEYRLRAIEILKENEIFKKQNKLTQNKLIAAMDMVVGRRKIKDVNAPIAAIKKTLKALNDNDWGGNLKSIKASINRAVEPLKGTRIHSENLKEIYSVLKTITDKNFEEKVNEINTILDQIKKDNTAENKKFNDEIKKLNNDIAKQLEKKDPATLKDISDVIKLVQKIESSKTIDDVGIIKRMLKAVKGINKDNQDVRLNQLINAVSDLVGKQETRRGKTAQLNNTIKNLKDKIKKRKEQIKNISKIKLQIAQSIRQATMALRDLGVKEYTYTEVQRLVYSVKNATPRTIIEELTKVDKALSTAKERYRKAKLKGILTTIKKYAKKGISKSKRVKAKTKIGAYGNDFFIAANNLIKLFFDEKNKGAIWKKEVKKNITTQQLLDAQEKMDSMKSLTKEEYKEVFEELDESTKKIIKQLTALDTATEAGNPFVLGLPNLLLGLDTMSLEELSKLELDLKKERLGFAEQLKEKIELEKEANNKLKAESAKQIQGNWDMLYEDADVEEDGKTVTKKVPIHDNTISPSLLEVLTQKGLKAALKKMRESIKISKKAVNFLGHMGTIMNTLDNIPAGDNFFTENIYNRLNRAIQRHVKGMQNQVEKLNDIAASINPNLTYDKIKTEIFNTATLKIPSRIRKVYGKKTVEYLEATGDLQVRIYALSKNEIQRQKLKNMGYTDQVLLDIENNLDPDVKAFADKIVDYLSDDNFNRLDNVFRDVNNIGLNKIDNYFPTRTIHKKANKKDNLANVKDYAEGNFQQGFNAQHGSFLKNRVDLAGEIQLVDPNYNSQIGFTSELDIHLDGVERYIAFAQDVKILNRLFKSEDVVNLLQKTRLYKLTNQLINNTVNPIPATALPWFRKIISNFVGFKIGFKLWQIPKQASSFVMSFPEYTNAKTSHLPRAAEVAANIPLYIADQIAVMATFRSSLKEAKAASPMLRERIMSFQRAGFGALETAIDEGDISKNKRIEKIFNAINKAGGYPTHIGDLLGVMGYWAVYKRDIENGMNPTKALEKFENYNKTQQSRRATEINQWQLKSRENPFYLMATTFASMPLLLANQVMASSNNMTKIYRKAGGGPQAALEALGSPDGLRFLFALGVGNALFVATSNMFKFYGGDEEEREEVLIDVAKAAAGWNNLLAIPIFKGVVEEAESLFKDKQYGRSDLMNPIVQGIKDYKKMVKMYESKGFSQGSLEAARLFAGYSKGINLEPIISLLYYRDLFGGIGVSKSYLSKKQQRKK